MRKPLVLLSVVICLLFSGATPLLHAASDRQDISYDQPARWRLGALIVAKIYVPILPAPIYTNIFNDGPDPVESSEPKEGDGGEEASDNDDQDDQASPFDSGTNGTLSGTNP
jgi:hypothetical protein